MPDRFLVFLATGFYLSYMPVSVLNLFPHKQTDALFLKKWTGAGFLGSLLGAATYFVLPASFANSLLFLLAGVILAIVIAHRAEHVLHAKDDPRIIVDEWIGAWIALQAAGPSLGYSAILAFVLFRVFDSYKGPWGRWLQTLPGGFGVVLDDVAAGLIANVLMRSVRHVFL